MPHGIAVAPSTCVTVVVAEDDLATRHAVPEVVAAVGDVR
jgi:hypothetical protein